MRKLVLVLIVLGCISCREIDNKNFTTREREHLDSIYNEKVKVLKVEMDSLCVSTYEERLKHISDSIKAEYIKEIEAIIE